MGDMTWLPPTRIGRAIAGLAALLVAGLTFLTLDRRKTRNEAVDDITDRLQEADNAEATHIRRRAAAANELHDDSGRGFRD
jgi:hypothetical protein